MHSIAIQYRHLQLQDYAALLQLANQVHGDGYLDQQSLAYYHQLSIKQGLDASFVAYANRATGGFSVVLGRRAVATGSMVQPRICGKQRYRILVTLSATP